MQRLQSLAQHSHLGKKLLNRLLILRRFVVLALNSPNHAQPGKQSNHDQEQKPSVPFSHLALLSTTLSLSNTRALKSRFPLGYTWPVTEYDLNPAGAVLV
jgi:hypothetical protein